MYYIFDQENRFLASADFEPNLEDLASRGEKAIYSDTLFVEPVLNVETGEISEKINPVQAVEITLESAKTALISKIAEKTDRLKSSITASYPQTEIDSFYRQEQEARAFLNGEIANPEMLSQIAKVRNLPLTTLAQAVVRKADQFALVIGVILGQKQLFESHVNNAQSLDELNEIQSEVEQWSI